MPELSGMLVILLGLVMAPAIIMLSLNHFGIAVFLAALSPALPLMLMTNATDETGEMTNAGTYIRIALVFMLGIIGLITVLKNREEERKRLPIPFILLGMFAVFAVFSTLYSYDRQFTLTRAATSLAFFVFILGFYTWLSDFARLRQAFTMLFWMSALAILVNAAAVVLFPDIVWWWKLPNRYQGVWGNPNALGALCMVSYPILLWRLSEPGGKRLKVFIIVLFGLAGIMHILSGSRASLVASLIGIVIWFIASRQWNRIVILGGALLFAGITLSQSDIPSFNRVENKGMMDVTGRGEMWSSCLIMIRNSPLLGYGFDVEGKVWSDPRINKTDYYQEDATSRTSLHNGYISIMIGTGIPSLLLLVTLWVWPLGRLRRIPALRSKLVVLFIIIGCLFLNFLESTISGGRSVPSVFFWISWAVALKLPQLSSRIVALRVVDDNSIVYFSRAEWERYLELESLKPEKARHPEVKFQEHSKA